MPSTCHAQIAQVASQDCLMHLLYCGSSEPLLRALIAESMRNIAASYPTDGVRRALVQLVPGAGASLASLRALFFLLLNQDCRMRARVCEDRLAGYLPALCPYKACRFFDQLREGVVPGWIKDERVSLLELVERLKDAYLVS